MSVKTLFVNVLGSGFLPGLLLSLVWLPTISNAQNFSIAWFTVAGGGMRSSASNYELSGTVGQPATGTMTSGNYSVVGGFWSFGAAGPPSGISTSPSTVASPYIGIDFTDPAQALADPDGDGMGNLMEYALGNDPHNPSDGANGMSTSLTNCGGIEYLTLSFKRRKTTVGFTLQYIPEACGDAQSWSSADVTQVGVISLDNQFDWVTVIDKNAMSVSTPRFIRLRVVEN